jgi:phosphotransferase system  glucose/maltose/N-acetylglucosamine-specific IIC component
VAGSGALTLGLGTATVLSGMATLSTRDQIRSSVAAGQDAAAQTLYATGRDQQTRTNVLLGATIASGAGTVILALFTRWSDERRPRDLAVVPGRDGMSLVYAGRF